MKRLVGGDYSLDLSPIEIEESVDGETYTSITDKSVLDQLTGLKSFIGKSGMIKPVWIRLLNGETDEIVVTRGSISTSDGTTFLIRVLLVGFILTLSVEFTQMLNEDEEPLDDWYIDTNDAKYILISDTQSLAGELADFEGDVSITGDLSVTGKINNEANPSVKPIYCHPINFQYSTDGGRIYFISCLIFNNDATPFTSDSFYDYVLGLITDYDAIIMASGAVWTGNSILVATNLSDNGSGGIAIRGLLGGTVDFYSITKVDMRGGTFTDGVNQIN